MMTKEQILVALRGWVNQRPGLEFCNYGDVPAYRSELRSITKDRRDAMELLNAVALRDSIKAEELIAAFPHAFSGRLTITEKDGRPQLDYCTGQYWPTEYRKAACAVLASVLWGYARECMPAPTPGKKITRTHGPFSSEHDSIEGLTPGDWLRRFFRREFGQSIARRWFS